MRVLVMLKPICSHRWRPALYALALAVLASGVPAADLLVTLQGESLSGELTRIVDGVLVFRTSLHGQMMVPVSEVKSLSTESDWAVTDSAGAVHIGRFVPGGIAGISRGSEERLEEALALPDVASAKRLPSAIGTGEKQEPGTGWSGEVSVGTRAFSGTESGVEPHVRAGVRGVNEFGTLDLRLGVDATDSDEFPRYFKGQFEMTGPAAQSWAPFVQALIDRDRNEALRLRTGLTLGMRYSFDASETGAWQVLAGVGASHGRWNRGFPAGQGPWGLDGSETETNLNLHLELRYSRAVWGGATWNNRIYLLPDVTDADDFRAGAASSLVYPVSTRLQLRLDMLLGYDHAPVFSELDSVDTSLGASIQLDF